MSPHSRLPVSSLRRDQRGVTMLEYILVAAFLVLAAIGIWEAFLSDTGSATEVMGETLRNIGNAHRPP